MCLGQCDTEKIVSRVHADKLNDESFDTVEEHVEEEEGARDVQAFAYGPKDGEDDEAHDDFVEGSWVHGRDEVVAVIADAVGHLDAFIEHVARVVIGPEPVGQEEPVRDGVFVDDAPVAIAGELAAHSAYGVTEDQ